MTQQFEDGDPRKGVTYPEVNELTELDKAVKELAMKYDKDARDLLRELIRIPADHYERDPMNGTSNHEGERLHYLKKRIFELGAVTKPDDVFFDAFGSLCWVVTDEDDKTPKDQKKCIYLDGHSDTVYPLRDDWKKVIGEGIDCYNGMINKDKVSEAALKRELRYIPPKEKWDSLIFGRGSADQLQGVVSQVFATKIMLETKHLGSLKGVTIYSIATVQEEDNDGGSPMHIMRKQQLPYHLVPDAVIFTEGTGDLERGPCGIYIGHRGRCQIEVSVTGTSCHGSMPHMGINPLEYAAAIIKEGAEQAKDGFKPNSFLGKGTRTASWCKIETPSDCAVPAKFTFRFDRRMTVGEDSALAIKEVEALKSIQAARDAGCTVEIKIPFYDHPTHLGVKADNHQDYMGWMTPASDPVVQAAVESYKRTVTPYVEDVPNPGPDDLRKVPRVDRWIFSTDGVGFPLKKDHGRFSTEGKNWISVGEFIHPPMFGINAGFEHHCHKLGEYLHGDHLWVGIVVIARFPSLFVEKRK